MQLRTFIQTSVRDAGLRAALFSAILNPIAPLPVHAETAKNSTASSIKHVIIIIGENRTFDHVFATYVPKQGETVSNLLSKGIVNADGTPGPNYSLSAQYSASDKINYSLHPGDKKLYNNIPPVVAGGAKTPYFPSITVAKQFEPVALPNDYYKFMTTGGTGLNPYVDIDTRIPNVNNLGSGVFQLTPGVKYDDYANSPVHRFYQMWQQLDCNVSHATAGNPSGCLADLFPWVEVTIGAGSDGSSTGSTAPPTNLIATGEGSTAMEFYNVQQGDAPYLKSLADKYTLNDNFHQSGQGGTGLNHIFLGFADGIWYSDGMGHPAIPPSHEIENPNPQPGTNNWYISDGYGGSGASGGGSYSDCGTPGQPGVDAVASYLQSLSPPIKQNCQAGHYYLLNNYNPGYNANGTPVNLATSPFTIPPTSVRSIGDAMLDKGVSFKYYGDGWNVDVANPGSQLDTYCNICNPFQYESRIMTNTTLRTTHIQDLSNFYSDVNAGQLPAVSILKPGWPTDGHPASSKLDLFEGFTKKVVEAVQASPETWASTAIFVTFDEGGGYYDSGYVQPLDFFGDGARIPLIVVSPFAQGGHVNHSYGDHVSLVKFIERNWNLGPLTARSRDNDPNPVTAASDPYVPLNSPAIDDLFDTFNFSHASERLR
jgi:phospholipase C